jgi:hypothetical protein
MRVLKLTPPRRLVSTGQPIFDARTGGRAAREQRYIGGVFGLLVLTSLIGFRR